MLVLTCTGLKQWNMLGNLYVYAQSEALSHTYVFSLLASCVPEEYVRNT